MDKDLAELCIGALLHDIGKISERAKLPLTEQSKRMEHLICPTERDGRYGYHHVPYTSQFFEQFRYQLPSDLDAGKIANIASCHHKPDNDPVHFIVQEADCLSAGQDRQKNESNSSSKNAAQTGVRDFANSIFSSIPCMRTLQKVKEYQLPICPLQLSDSAFGRVLYSSDATSEYASLWQTAVMHFQQLRPINSELFIEQLMWVLGLYGGCVPSHRTQFFEISLFDHSSTTAAIACALYQYHKQTHTFKENAIKDKITPKFLIVQGDLSGIQSYLYHTSLEEPSGLSKRLRAKSFYLGFITRLAGSLLLHKLGLPPVNRIIDAGGNFTLLVHNTPQSVETIKQTERCICQWFRRTFAGNLYLNLCYNTELSANDFTQEQFFRIQQKLSFQMDIAKRQSQKSILTDHNRWDTDNFMPVLDPALIVRVDNKLVDKSEEFFELLGGKLAHNNVMLISTHPFQNQQDDPFARLPLSRPFDTYYFSLAQTFDDINDQTFSCTEFVPSHNIKSLKDIPSGRFIANYVPRITEQDYRFYAQQKVQEWLVKQFENDDLTDAIKAPKSFAHLCADSFMIAKDHTVKGIPLLAILKADVDRLGMLFSKGLQEAKGSLSYYISLSRQLDLFFSGILPNYFIEPPKEYPDFRNIYTVYAGGDDLLLVGPWRTILKFAPYLQSQLRKYTCHHPDITLSAGISVCHSRFPLSQAAEQADAALHKAKENRNRICVFDTVLEWPQLEQAIDDALFLDRIMQDDGAEGIAVKKAFIYRLLLYSQMAQECNPENTSTDRPSKKINLKKLLWRSHLKYDIARNVKILDKNNRRPSGLERLEKMTALTKDSSEMSRLKVAVTYCLYMNR